MLLFTVGTKIYDPRHKKKKIPCAVKRLTNDENIEFRNSEYRGKIMRRKLKKIKRNTYNLETNHF